LWFERWYAENNKRESEKEQEARSKKQEAHLISATDFIRQGEPDLSGNNFAANRANRIRQPIE